MRIGHGYDVHRLVEGRDLILGGVKLEYELGLLGHSDADAKLDDALVDAYGEEMHDSFLKRYEYLLEYDYKKGKWKK